MERLHAWLAALLLACSGGTADGPAAGDDLRPLPPSAARDVASPVLTVSVLRVSSRSGGGDAILVADSSVAPPRHILIDAGDDGAAADALRALRVPSLDLMILTHAHHDHYGGMDDVLDAVPVRAFAFNGQARSAVTYRRLLERVRDEIPVVLVVDEVRRVRLGEGEGATSIVLLPPYPRWLGTDTDDGERINEGSLAVRVERGRFSLLSTGDGEDEANLHFAARFPELVDADVLKLGHHGSADATDAGWLDAVTPEVAAVSANGTTHPHAPVLALVEGRGIDLYCTPQHGRIRIRVAADGAFAVRTEASPRLRCRPGSER